MRINKRHIIILVATIVLAVPAINIKAIIHPDNQQDLKPVLSLAIVEQAQAEEQQKIADQQAAEVARLAEIEKQRVAAVEAAQAAEAEKQRLAAVEAQRAAEEAARVANCGPQDPAVIYQILTGSGVPRLSAIQILGSWKTESGGDFNHCQKRGDSGVAWGLNSWHPGRRADMPENLRDQVIWAIHTEMKRDCSSCYDVIMSPGQSITAIRTAIQSSTRWGVEGARWQYANEFARQF